MDLQNLACTARRIERVESGFAAAYRLPENTSEKSLSTHTPGANRGSPARDGRQ